MTNLLGSLVRLESVWGEGEADVWGSERFLERIEANQKTRPNIQQVRIYHLLGLGPEINFESRAAESIVACVRARIRSCVWYAKP